MLLTQMNSVDYPELLLMQYNENSVNKLGQIVDVVRFKNF